MVEMEPMRRRRWEQQQARCHSGLLKDIRTFWTRIVVVIRASTIVQATTVMIDYEMVT